MKKFILTFLAFSTLLISLSACNENATNESAAKLLTEVKTTQYFTDEEIPEEDITKILSAGINAPSAMNTQPWHFTAVTDKETTDMLKDAMSKMKPPMAPPEGAPPDAPKPPEGAPKPPEGAPKPPEGNSGFSKAPNKAGIGDAPLTIVISCKEGSELDAGLAIQNMSAEAQLLGYGTKIMTAPTMALNSDEYKKLLNVPEGHKIAAVLIIGKAKGEESDAVTGATKKADDKKPDGLTSASVRNKFDEMVTLIK